MEALVTDIWQISEVAPYSTQHRRSCITPIGQNSSAVVAVWRMNGMWLFLWLGWVPIVIYGGECFITEKYSTSTISLLHLNLDLLAFPKWDLGFAPESIHLRTAVFPFMTKRFANTMMGLFKPQIFVAQHRQNQRERYNIYFVWHALINNLAISLRREFKLLMMTLEQISLCTPL
jgi:hypothetical protein